MGELKILRWPGGQSINQQAVAQIWKREGFGCDLWVDEPGQQWLDFIHPTDERALVQEGQIEFEVEGVRARLRPGDEVFIPVGCRHNVWNRGSSAARRFYGYRRQ